ncbi:MAG: hypothetical protein KC588_10850 [Nitrospira sp.]|nr:hypothetical protein [Nitrospira sp.]
MGDKNSCIGIYNTHVEAENGIKVLQKAGFDMKKLSIVAKGYQTEEHAAGFYNTGDRVKFWGKAGAFWGALWGILFGWAFFWIPGIGPLIVAGPLVSTILAGLEGAVAMAGLSALGAALYSMGIPKDSIVSYETALQAEKFLLIVHGTSDEVTRAKEMLNGLPDSQVHAHMA